MVQRLIGSIILLVWFAGCNTISETGFSESALKALGGLVERTLPAHSKQFVFKKLTNAQKADSFAISAQGGSIQIAATSVSAASYAFGYYLKYICGMHLSRAGTQTKQFTKLPQPTRVITGSTDYRQRYYLNYCTYNYSHSFQTPEQWQWEVDWMALQGINMPLAILGTEKVWYNTLLKAGCTDAEIKSFIAGPAFTAWWLMDNLEGWGGPVSMDWMDAQQKMQQQIVSQMRALGMEPVFQGFYGMVPNVLQKKYPNARILSDTGNWCGGFKRPAFLDPTDPLFDTLAQWYYTELHQLYGKTRFYGGDPLHEGGKLNGIINRKQAAIRIQAAMLKASPNSTWLLQGWWENPSDSLLMGTDPKQTMVLDLWGETQPFWERRQSYLNSNFIWCALLNFGGRTGNWGRMDTIIAQPKRIKASEYAHNLVGIGVIPEGDATNPVNYDFVYESAWTTGPITAVEWSKGYASYRYGIAEPSTQKAWQLLVSHVYNCPMGSYTGPGGIAQGFTDMGESVFCARPAWNLKGASTWAPALGPHYPDSVLDQIVTLLLQAPEAIRQTDTYQYDLIDLTRQRIANKAFRCYKALQKAFVNKQNKEYETEKNRFLKLLLLQDSVVATRPEFLLGTWIQAARKAAFSKQEADLFEWNARMLLTLWGNKKAAAQLHDYANKEWSGLLSGFYYPRWMLFFEAIEKNKKPDFETFEWQWVQQTNSYPNKPTGNALFWAEKAHKQLLSDSFLAE